MYFFLKQWCTGRVLIAVKEKETTAGGSGPCVRAPFALPAQLFGATPVRIVHLGHPLIHPGPMEMTTGTHFENILSAQTHENDDCYIL